MRSSLRRAGLELRSLLTAAHKLEKWSSGTLAAKQSEKGSLAVEGPGWSALSAMEEEHLQTRASVPYRDPDGEDEAGMIQHRRKLEQDCCDLESTSAWQRRWRDH